MRHFTAIEGSSIYDVCLNTYGSLNRLVKLMDDNSFDGVDTAVKAGQIFEYDETLVDLQVNQNLSQSFNVLAGDSQLKYASL